MSNDEHENGEAGESSLADGRRQVLKALGAGAGYALARVALPALWSSPVVATLALPQHAQASGAGGTTSVDPGFSCGGAEGGTADATTGVIAADTSVAGKATLTIKPPQALLTGKTPYLLCQKDGGVVTTIFPSSNATASGSLVQVVTRAAGPYEFQLRWSGGHTAWTSVVIK